jgi:hypothetical protein
VHHLNKMAAHQISEIVYLVMIYMVKQWVTFSCFSGCVCARQSWNTTNMTLAVYLFIIICPWACQKSWDVTLDRQIVCTGLMLDIFNIHAWIINESIIINLHFIIAVDRGYVINLTHIICIFVTCVLALLPLSDVCHCTGRCLCFCLHYKWQQLEYNLEFCE